MHTGSHVFRRALVSQPQPRAYADSSSSHAQVAFYLNIRKIYRASQVEDDGRGNSCCSSRHYSACSNLPPARQISGCRSPRPWVRAKYSPNLQRIVSWSYLSRNRHGLLLTYKLSISSLSLELPRSQQHLNAVSSSFSSVRRKHHSSEATTARTPHTRTRKATVPPFGQANIARALWPESYGEGEEIRTGIPNDLQFLTANQSGDDSSQEPIRGDRTSTIAPENLDSEACSMKSYTGSAMRKRRTFRKTGLGFRKISPSYLSDAHIALFEQRMRYLAERKTRKVEGKRLKEQKRRHRLLANHDWEDLFNAFKLCSRPLSTKSRFAVCYASPTDIEYLPEAFDSTTGSCCHVTPFGETVRVKIWASKHDKPRGNEFPSTPNSTEISDQFQNLPKKHQPKLGGCSTPAIQTMVTGKPFLEPSSSVTSHSSKGLHQFNIWTAKDFFSLVRDVVQDKRATLDTGRHFAYDRAATLRYSFEVVAPRYGVAGPEAVEMAIKWLLDHAQTPFARDLLDDMDNLGSDFKLRANNLFLRRCAQEENPAAMGDRLEIMAERGIRPDAESWVALIRVARCTIDKQRTVREMHRRNYFEQTDVARSAVPEIISYSLSPFLEAGGSLMEYTDMLSQLYSLAWLSRTALHRIFTVLAKQLRYTDALDLIKNLADTLGYAPSIVDFDVLISQCRWPRDIATAVSLVTTAMDMFGVAPSSVTFDRLFAIAWVTNNYNVARVVWKYACASGQASYKMRDRVIRSLTYAHTLHEPANSRSTYRADRIGCVICGVRRSACASVEEHNGLVRDIVDKERALYGSSLPTRALSDVLADALVQDLDESWRAARETEGVEWFVENAVDVPMRPCREDERRKWRERSVPSWTRTVTLGARWTRGKGSEGVRGAKGAEPDPDETTRLNSEGEGDGKADR